MLIYHDSILKYTALKRGLLWDNMEITYKIVGARGEIVRVAIFGGSGFIGMELAKELVEQGHEVVIVSRGTRGSEPHFSIYTWEQLEHEPERLEGFDAFVNLAGETINQRWSDKAKSRILQSRIAATRQVAAIVARLKVKPEVVINGSGMSIYGYSEQETFDEHSPKRLTDFLGRTVNDWEQAADEIQGVRLVKLRIGLVLGKSGGAFPLMQLPYRLFVGGRVGSGKQWHSWIHIADMTGIIHYCIMHKEINGPINCTAPNPVTNDAFGRLLGKTIGRPHYFPVPSFLLKLVLGEMSEVLLCGQRVLPTRITEMGYRFKYPSLQDAYYHLFKRGER